MSALGHHSNGRNCKDLPAVNIENCEFDTGTCWYCMVIYGIWMGRVWQRDMQDSSFDDFDSSAPW